MSPIRRTLAAACLGGMLFSAVALADEPKITTITPEKPVRQWVVEETTGRIFASMPTADAVVEYDPATGKELRRLAIKGNPAEMVLKGHWLVAACPKSAALALIDLKENKVSGTVSLSGSVIRDLFCSKADNPYVYALCDPNAGGMPAANVPLAPGSVTAHLLVRVDLKRKEALPVASAASGGSIWIQQNLLPVAMARDGQRLLVCWYNGGFTRASGLFDVDEGAGTFQQLPSGINGVRGYGAVTAAGRWWTVGNCLFPTEPGPPLRTFAGSPVAIHPVLDLAASLQESQLVLQTFSAAETLKEIDLPDAPVAEGPQPGVASPARGPGAAAPPPTAATETVQYDLAGSRVFCGLASKGYVVGLDNLGVKFPNRLELVIPNRTTAAVGKTTRVPLASNAPRGGAKPEFTLDSPPPFAKIDHNDLVLAPSLTQIGTHEVVVKASQGDLSDEVTLSIRVEVPGVHLGFFIRGVALDRQRKSTVAWGQSAASGAAASADSPMDFALVDLASQKVVNTHSMPGGVQFIALDEKFVFVIPPTPHVLYRLDRADPSRSQRVLLGGTPLALAATPDHRVAVEISDSAGFLLRLLDRRTLQPGAGDDGDRGRSSLPYNRSGALPIAEPLGDGAVQQLDQVVEAETGEPRCWLSGRNLPDLVELAARGSYVPAAFRAGNGSAGGRQLWGRAIVNGQLVMAEGKAVATLPPGAQISPDYPLAAGLRSAWTGRSQKTELVFWNLVLGEAIDAIDISPRSAGLPAGVGPAVIAAPWPSAGFNSGNGVDQAGLTFVKDTVLLPQGNRLLFCPIPAAVRKDLPVPLVLKYPRIGIGSVQKPLEVQFAAVGGEGRRTFTAARKYEGLVLDAAGGKATLDLPAIWKKCLSALKQPAGRPSLERQADTVRSEFRRLTGRPLAADQFAFAVPLEVMVSDEQGQQDRLNLSVIVLAPAEELGKAPAGPGADPAASQPAPPKTP